MAKIQPSSSFLWLKFNDEGFVCLTYLESTLYGHLDTDIFFQNQFISPSVYFVLARAFDQKKKTYQHKKSINGPEWTELWHLCVSQNLCADTDRQPPEFLSLYFEKPLKKLYFLQAKMWMKGPNAWFYLKKDVRTRVHVALNNGSQMRECAAEDRGFTEGWEWKVRQADSRHSCRLAGWLAAW